MKLERTRKDRGRNRQGKDIFHQKMTERIYKPEDILTPEVVANVLKVKKEMEGGMIGDPTEGYVGFLAAARLALPEQEEKLRPAAHMEFGIQRRIGEETRHLVNLDPTKFSHEVLKLREYALLKPKETGDALRPAAENILKAIEHELSGERTYFGVSLAVTLWISLPETREKVQRILSKNRSKLLQEGHEVGWVLGPNLCLIDPEYKEEFTPGPFFETGRLQIINRLPNMLGKPTYGDPRDWTWVLNGVAALAVGTASEVKLQDNGTIRFTFTKKLGKSSQLPERPAV